MKIPDINNMDVAGNKRYSTMLELQKEINSFLQVLFENNKDKNRDYLAKIIISNVEQLIDKLNEHNYNLGRCNYGGDINYENSEQSYSNGKEMGYGLIIDFKGFTAQVSWENA